MKAAALAILLAAPLAAQTWEVGLNVSQQSYKEFGSDPWVAPKKTTPIALRAGYAVFDLGPALFQITAAYQPKVESDLENGFGQPSPVRYGHEYYGIGAMFNFKALVAVGAGVDYRFEKASYTGGLIDRTTSFARPWARVNAGFAFPTPVVKPFIGLEVAAPLTSYSQDDANNATSVTGFADGFNKAVAPKLQIGVYGGIRF